MRDAFVGALAIAAVAAIELARAVVDAVRST